VDGQKDLLGVLHQQILELLLDLQLLWHRLHHCKNEHTVVSQFQLPPQSHLGLSAPCYMATFPSTRIATAFPLVSVLFTARDKVAGLGQESKCKWGVDQIKEYKRRIDQIHKREATAYRPLRLDVFESKDCRPQHLHSTTTLQDP
jgi:hypothetical protein